MPFSPEDPERMRQALHEAGHCVLLHALGLELPDLRLEDDASECRAGAEILAKLGDPARLDHDDPQIAVLLEARTVALLAGPAAEGLALPHLQENDPAALQAAVLSNVQVSWRGDLERTLAVLTAIPAGPGEREAYLSEAAARADEMLSARLPAVTALAAELLAHRALDRARIAHVIADMTASGPA